MIIGNKEFDTKHNTYVMGILNVTPDSFSDGGSYNSVDNALKHCEKMVNDGVDIIDVGGESTRPNYTQISDEQEISRVCPIIEAIKNNFDVPVSIDTYKSNVAQKAVRSGADMVNDIWGLKYQQSMAQIIAENNVACCLMHNKNEAKYNNLVEDVKSDLAESLTIAKNAGISKDKIILDVGIGFGKTYEMNLQLIKNLREFCKGDYPILLGCSRKSVIGLTLDLPTNERLEGTLVTTTMAVLGGCSFVRVHDVKENIRAIKMARAILEV